jgi:dihydrofolate reductase
MNDNEESAMTVPYTWDVFCSLDGFASYNDKGDWGGYWGKQGPEFLDSRLATMAEAQRLVLGANTFRQFLDSIGKIDESQIDPVNGRTRSLPLTVVSTTLDGPFDWPDVTVEAGDAVEVVSRLKNESTIPLRSHGSLSLNRSLMTAGLVDRIQLTVFPVLTGQTGIRPVFEGAADFDLELIDSKVFDGRTQELTYVPTLHR